MSRRATAIAIAAIALVIAVAGAAWVAAGLSTDPGTSATGDGVAAPAPHFVDESATAGVDHAYDGEFTYFVGGGVAVLDCDDDGRPDLYVAGGAGPAGLFRNVGATGGELAFEPVRSAVTDLDAVTGAYPLDIDGDGTGDLAVMRQGENVLLRGTGGCGFERANERWGFDGGGAWSTAFSATWEDESGLPTLAVGNYLVLEGGEPAQDYDCGDNELFRPDGAAYATPTALAPGWCTLSMLFSDWDRSGRRDLRVSNDRHYEARAQEQLWRVDPGAAPRLWTPDDGWQPLRIWGMGIAGRDLTGDGLPEYYLTSQADNKLQTLADGPSRPAYVDIAIARGATAHKPYVGDTTMRSTAWHAEFDDANNDGYVDLFVAKGNVEAQSEYAMRDPSNLLIGQPDGTFVEGGEEAGIASFARARGGALVDFNLDGLLDLVMVNRREQVGLWRNVGAGTDDEPAPMGNWLALRPVQNGANRDAIGAWIEVRAGGRTSLIELIVGGGHVSGQLGWTHVGLGEADAAEVRIVWPDGVVGDWQRADANQFVIVDRDGEELRPWQPAPSP
jgi:hypothetical protein